MQATYINLAAMDVVKDIANHCDDSNGEIMDGVYPGFEEH